MQLSKEQLAFFNENGFLLLRGFANPRKCDIIKDIAKVHLNYAIEPIETEYEYIGIEKKEYKTTIRRLRQVYNRDIVFKKWMENKKIYPILEQILQDKPILITAHHNSIMTKMPKTSTKTCWHQDIRYWRYNGDNLVSVWLALGEENEKNGVLEFIPKSHKMNFSKEAFDEKLFFREDYEANKPLIQSKVSFNLHKGDIVLFHAKTLHQANANMSEETKISFVYTVKAKSLKALPNTRSASFKEIELGE